MWGSVGGGGLWVVDFVRIESGIWRLGIGRRSGGGGFGVGLVCLEGIVRGGT